MKREAALSQLGHRNAQRAGAMSHLTMTTKLKDISGSMTTISDAPDQALLVRNRLQSLGVSDVRDRDRLLARLRRHARPGEALLETLDRRLCEWLNEQPLKTGLAGHHKRATIVAGAEAAIVLSGLAERWPLALFDSSIRLPAEALRRLELAVPVAAPPVVQVAMPVQPLEPVSVRDLTQRPATAQSQPLRAATR